MVRRILPAVAVMVLAPTLARAGIYIETARYDTRTGASFPEHEMYIQEGAVRIQQSRAGATGELMIFRDDAVYVLEPAHRSYTVLDRATLRAVGGVMSDATARLRAELDRLSPEQRALVEQLMGDKVAGAVGAGGRTPRFEARDTGRADSIAGQECRNWEITRDGAVIQELCVVPFSALPGKEDLAGLARRMGTLVEELVDVLAGMGFHAGGVESMDAVQGYPVRIRQVNDGKPDPVERVLKQWREEAVPEEMFEVPEDYERRDLQREIDKARPRAGDVTAVPTRP